MFTWTEDLGPAQGVLALEGDYRKAIVAAVNHLEGLRGSGVELPRFTGGTFASTANATAKAMEAVTLADVAIKGIPRAMLLTVAVRIAEHAYYAGEGDEEKAKATIKAMLPQQQTQPRSRTVRL
jgi:hypothetical protein